MIKESNIHAVSIDRLRLQDEDKIFVAIHVQKGAVDGLPLSIPNELCRLIARLANAQSSYNEIDIIKQEAERKEHISTINMLKKDEDMNKIFQQSHGDMTELKCTTFPESIAEIIASRTGEMTMDDGQNEDECNFMIARLHSGLYVCMWDFGYGGHLGTYWSAVFWTNTSFDCLLSMNSTKRLHLTPNKAYELQQLVSKTEELRVS